jgi:hypothetical protein
MNRAITALDTGRKSSGEEHVYRSDSNSNSSNEEKKKIEKK